MSKGGASIEGLDVLSRRLKALPATIEAANRRSVREETTAVANDMRRGAPRDSGELQESIQGEFDAKRIEGTAAATARHAAFVENGTSDTPAQPFAEPAAERSRHRFPDRVKADVLAELRKIT